MKYIVDCKSEKTPFDNLHAANTFALNTGYGFPEVRIIEVEDV